MFFIFVAKYNIFKEFIVLAIHKKYFPQIDTLRFIAVVLVIINHWLPNHWVNHFQLGRLGVDLFFVISGFLITKILFQLKDSSSTLRQKLKTFFIRRILRVFPLYYFVVILTTFFNRGIFSEALPWNLLYGSNFFILSIDTWPGVMSHFWTLSVEEHFYLFWPFIILIPNKKWIVYAISFTALLGLLSRYYFFIFDFPFLYTYIFTSSCFDAFAIGGILAFLCCYKPNYLFHKILDNKFIFAICLLGLLFSIYSLNFQGYNHNIWNFVFFRFFSACVFFIVIGLAIDSKSSILNNPHFVFLGKLSYSMYLFHNFIPGFLLGVQYPTNIYLRLLLYFPLLVLVSYGSWKLIELPFNALKQKFKYSP